MNRGSEAGDFLQRVLQQRNNLTADSAYLIARIFLQNNQKEQAKLALEQVLQQAGNGMFMFRKDAEKTLKELGGTVPQAGGPAAAAPAAASSAAPATGRETAGGTRPRAGATQTPPVAGQ
jgi:hypothetical protein